MQRRSRFWMPRRPAGPCPLPLLRHPARSGWTVLELTVVITITALLLALLLPAIGAVRESARRMDCSTRLREMALALHQYESTYGVFPMGVVARNHLVPYLGEVVSEDLLHEVETTPHWEDPPVAHAALMARRVPPILCPSEPAELLWGKYAPANYAGNYGSGWLTYGFDGFFCRYDSSSTRWLPEQRTRPSDITDGLSNTVAFSEMLPSNGRFDRLRTVWQLPFVGIGVDDYDQIRQGCLELPAAPELAQVAGYNLSRYHGAPWTTAHVGSSLYNHGLPPNSPSCDPGNTQHAFYSAASLHSGGVNAAFGDGHVAFVSEAIDGEAWREMGSRGPSQFLRDVYERERPEF